MVGRLLPEKVVVQLVLQVAQLVLTVAQLVLPTRHDRLHAAALHLSLRMHVVCRPLQPMALLAMAS